MLQNEAWIAWEGIINPTASGALSRPWTPAIRYLRFLLLRPPPPPPILDLPQGKGVCEYLPNNAMIASFACMYISKYMYMDVWYPTCVWIMLEVYLASACTLLYCNTVEPCYNEVLGTIKITLLYQVSHYIRVKKLRNVKSWDQQNYLVIRGFCYIWSLYNEVPLYTQPKKEVPVWYFLI